MIHRKTSTKSFTSASLLSGTGFGVPSKLKQHHEQWTNLPISTHSLGTLEEPLTSDNSRLLEDTQQKQYSGKLAVIVGAGPAGATAAAYLARHGFSVEVFEGREDLRKQSAPSQRVYPIALSTETVQVMIDIGVDPPSENNTSATGINTFKKSCIIRRDDSIGTRNVEANRALGTRYDITRCIVNAVERDASDKVHFHFKHTCKSIDFVNNIAVFEDRHRSRMRVIYDLLIAADGSNSVVRESLVEFDASLRVRVNESLSTYVTLGPFDATDASTSVIRAWASKRVNCASMVEVLERISGRGSYALSIPRLPKDGSLEDLGWTFFYPAPDGKVYMLLAKRSLKFESKKMSLTQWAKGVIPDIYPETWRRKMIEAMEDPPEATSFPKTIRLSRFNGPRTIIIGDAAHGISATNGFGCNMAITDSKALTSALTQADGNIDSVATMFNDLRYEEAQSYLSIDEAFSFDRKAQTVGEAFWRFLCFLHRFTFLVVGKVLPKFFRPAAPYNINDGKLTATQVYRRIKRESIIILGLFLTALLWSLPRFIAAMTRYFSKTGPLV